MTRAELVTAIKAKRTFLCVGLDTDIDRIPKKFLRYDDPVLAFNQAIIEITAPYCVAYKPNTAFYERYGAPGWITLEKTIKAIPESHLIIADAKRGDIGNTSRHYARAFFESLGADAITVAPYMGADSVEPFLEWEGKWVILLGVTSNAGSADFQRLPLAEKEQLYEAVVRRATAWGSPEELMFVVGATAGDDIERVRKIAPGYFFLVPGVGAQGGSLTEVAHQAMTKDCGLIVNASRSIIYANNSANFEDAVVQSCRSIQQEMEKLMVEHGVIG